MAAQPAGVGVALLLPSYLFVRVGGPIEIGEVSRSFGVALVVRAQGFPLGIPAEIMVALKARCDDDGVVIAPELVVEPGKSYRIAPHSPLKGLIALVERLGGEGVRAWVELLGASVPVTLAPSDLILD